MNSDSAAAGLLSQRGADLMRRRLFGAQRPADREEGGDQHGHRHQHEEPAQRGVDLVAEYDGFHVFQRLGRRNDRALLDAGGEFLRLRQEADARFLMEDLLPAGGHGGHEQPGGRQNSHPGVTLFFHLEQHHGAEDQRH